MSNEEKLTLTFLDRVPKAAAQELQALPAEQAAALIDAVPARLAAPVIGAMIPWQAARLLEAVPASRAALVLRELYFPDAISLARLVDPQSRNRILEEMPTKYAGKLGRALEYPQYQVGAWIDADVPTLSLDDTVHDALRVMRASYATSHVFVESTEHGTYVGVISIVEILRAEASMPLSRLKALPVAPVSNRASLSSLGFDERWDELLHLPVVGRRGNLLGGISRATLRHAIQVAHEAPPRRRRSLLRELTGAFAVACSGLAQLTSETITSREADSEGMLANER